MKYKYKQVAKATIGGEKKYQVVQVNKQYFQILLNRKKIEKNMEGKKMAIITMLRIAICDLEDLF